MLPELSSAATDVDNAVNAKRGKEHELEETVRRAVRVGSTNFNATLPEQASGSIHERTSVHSDFSYYIVLETQVPEDSSASITGHDKRSRRRLCPPRAMGPGPECEPGNSRLSDMDNRVEFKLTPSNARHVSHPGALPTG
jgi:hypothetical protein